MAIRFDDAADRILRTADLLNYNAAYTVMAWVRTPADYTSITASFICLNTDAYNNQDRIYGNAGYTRMFSRTTSSAESSAILLANSTWYHITMLRTDATNGSLWIDGVEKAFTTPDVSARTAVTRFEFGGETSGDWDPLGGRVAAIKAWSAALSEAEIAAEVDYYTPIRTANNYAYWPCYAGAVERLRDYSANVRHWTEGGTLTDEDDPPDLLWEPVVESTQAPRSMHQFRMRQ